MPESVEQHGLYKNNVNKQMKVIFQQSSFGISLRDICFYLLKHDLVQWR